VEKDMTINEQIDTFISTLPEHIDEEIYIVLYDKDFHDDFRTRLIEARDPVYAHNVVLLDKKGYNEAPWHYFDLHRVKRLFIFKETYNYIGNGYN
jgi:hypothetical protein